LQSSLQSSARSDTRQQDTPSDFASPRAPASGGRGAPQATDPKSPFDLPASCGTGRAGLPRPVPLRTGVCGPCCPERGGRAVAGTGQQIYCQAATTSDDRASHRRIHGAGRCGWAACRGCFVCRLLIEPGDGMQKAGSPVEGAAQAYPCESSDRVGGRVAGSGGPGWDDGDRRVGGAGRGAYGCAVCPGWPAAGPVEYLAPPLPRKPSGGAAVIGFAMPSGRRACRRTEGGVTTV
jgi:hypothetical protein